MTVSIHTVAENLRNTIKGKEAYLAGIEEDIAILTKDRSLIAYEGEIGAKKATKEFLKININELKVILHDVEQCAEQFNLMSWEINPERMGQ